MAFFRTKRHHDTREKDDWRRNISATVGNLRPTNKYFPWTRLQEFTNAYVERRGRLTQDQIDDHLKDLIKTHTEAEVAFAACANFMSPRSVRIFLTEGLSASHNSNFGFGLVPSLQAIVAANQVKPEAASKIESDWAFELIKHSNGPCSEEYLGERLCEIISLLKSGMPADFLLRDHAIALARKICQNFALYLETLSARNRWVDAFVAVEWLSKLSAASIGSYLGEYGPLQLLDSCLPTWRAWAAWRPNMTRLYFLKETAIDRNDSLRDLLAIDGPDFTNHGQTSLKGLIAQGLVPREPRIVPQTVSWGSTSIQLTNNVANELRSILDRLSSSIDAASQGGLDYITLLAHLCTSRTISYDVIQILEGVDCLPQHLIGPVSQIYTEGYSESVVLQAFKQVWLALDNDCNRSLRESLAPNIVTCTTNYVWKKRIQLYEQLENNKPWSGIEVDLIDFANRFPRTSWLWPMLDHSLTNYFLFVITGPSLELINTMGALRIYIQNALPRHGLSLISQIDAYCKFLLFPQCNIDSESIELAKALSQFWQRNTDGDRRDLALQVARCSGTEKQLSCQRISQIIGLDKEMVSSVLAIFRGCGQNRVDSLFNFSMLLVKKATPELRDCWRMILYYEIHSQDEYIYNQALNTLTTKRWFQWLEVIQSLFQDMMDWYSPALLKPEVHTWAQRLLPFLPTLESLENNTALPCILRGYNAPTNEKLERILIWIEEIQGIHWRRVIDPVIADLDISGSNAGEIEGELATLSKMTSKGMEVCIDILGARQGESMQFAEIYLSGLLQSPDLSVIDRKALIILATHCRVHRDAGGTRSGHVSDVAANYFAGSFRQLLAEAQRLEDLRLSLCAVDPDSVSKLLAKLQIEPTSSFDDMLATLPVTIVDVVERVGENEIEFRFPITNLSILQKHAIAAGEAENFFVRFEFSSKGIPTKFCIHLAETDVGDIKGHTPWDISRGGFAPHQRFCYGRPSRGVYQLSLIVWRRFRKGSVSLDNIYSLENIYSFISTSIANMSRSCIVCGIGKTHLRQSTICQNPSCRSVFSFADCEIVLADIWQNPTVADLLLTAIDAAAVSEKMELLTKCPITSVRLLLDLLSGLPTVDRLKTHLSSCINVYGDSFRLDVALAEYSSMTVQLRTGLIWAFNSHCGFLIAAVNQFRIPSFGAHQFLLANASPELEMAFATHIKTPESTFRILFHGTSLDRLHAILCQGLKVLSNTPLMRHATVKGVGIYMADEPATAWNYTSAALCGSAGSGWKHSSFSNHRVVLGCELAGEKPGKDGIHVITDPTRLMVRYIFLLDPQAKLPNAKDVRPAMQSVFASLRSGAV